MASVNKVILLGNLGADPEIRYTTGGQPVCEMRIATSRRYKGRDGAMQEDTQWHRVKVWGKQAENCKQYLSKGKSVFVEGRMETRSWEDRDGKKRWTTEVVALTVQFLGGRSGESAPRVEEEPPVPQDSEMPADFGDDDIPF